MRETPPKRDWAAFWIHFAFGALFGTAVGVMLWMNLPFEFTDSRTAGVICMLGGALACGVLAGLLGQNFWRDMFD